MTRAVIDRNVTSAAMVAPFQVQVAGTDTARTCYFGSHAAAVSFAARKAGPGAIEDRTEPPAQEVTR